MHPPELKDSPTPLNPEYIPLVVDWSLQLLSLIKFFHSRDILCGHPGARFLTSDLSLCVVGFLYATFEDGYGSSLRFPEPWDKGWDEDQEGEPTMARDLDDWATIVQIWWTGDWWSRWKDLRPPMSVPEFPRAYDGITGAEILKKCRYRRYDDAEVLWSEYTACLRDAGFVLDGDGLKEFDTSQFLKSKEGQDEDEEEDSHDHTKATNSCPLNGEDNQT
ncbi:hypothetical protein BT63DRAFT_112348 [Microthyrium microscopicum]|uniref:Protein kinase domain-containing protein n=1 Tax=Microthyrium microscopicum TaxID=703497 RepID=A0A6A6TYQ3_9PEZI|nr:hypothetical protein BT63DRAFT_112348 [Microthyrium microscopicum]